MPAAHMARQPTLPIHLMLVQYAHQCGKFHSKHLTTWPVGERNLLSATPILQFIQPSQAWQLDPDIAFFATAIDRCRATLSIIAIESKYVNVSCRSDSIHALMQIRETGPDLQGCQMHLAAKLRFECLRPLRR